jgi:Fe-S cluster assembly iron-binding protein IscA/shikimate kinase
MPRKDSWVIIWLNGTFGAGKTTTARHLARRLANARNFDPELVGYLLTAALEDHQFKNFQDLPPWRELVPVFTERIASFTGQHLIAVQTVLREEYWHELTQGFERTSLDIFHVLLHVDSDVLAERIKADEAEPKACQWRLDHISAYETSRPWMESAADLVIDATTLPAADVAERIAAEAERRVVFISLCSRLASQTSAGRTTRGDQHMLVLTQSAAEVVKSVTSTPELSEAAGLRISSSVAGPEDASALQVEAVAGPDAEDQVLEAAGARVFVAPQAASYLDDKILDAQLDQAGNARFSLGVQKSGEV